MSLQEFIAAYTGKSVSFPNCSDNQCMTLMHVYLQEVFNLTDPSLLANPSAYEVYTNYPKEAGSQYFDRVQNTLTGVPSSGDIVVFAANEGGTGIDGHVCLFISGDMNSFVSFDSNWPEGSLPHSQSHSTYTGVLGWLTPRPQGTFVDTATFDKLVSESTAFESFLTAGYTSPSDVHTKLQSLTDQNTALQKQVSDLTTKNTDLLGEVSSYQKLANEASAIPTPSADQGLEAIQQAKDVTYDINLVATDLGTTYPPVKNLTGEIDKMRNQLKAAQIALTKQAALNTASQTTQAVQTVSKGFFSWLKAQLWTSK